VVDNKLYLLSMETKGWALTMEAKRCREIVLAIVTVTMCVNWRGYVGFGYVVGGGNKEKNSERCSRRWKVL